MNENFKLTAQITSIDSTGRVMILFNDNILIPTEYSNFNDTTLKLMIVPGKESDPADLNFKWMISTFTNKTFTLQLRFENPMKVSLGRY